MQIEIDNLPMWHTFAQTPQIHKSRNYFEKMSANADPYSKKIRRYEKKIKEEYQRFRKANEKYIAWLNEDPNHLLTHIIHSGDPNDWEIDDSKYKLDGQSLYIASRVIKDKNDSNALLRKAK